MKFFFPEKFSPQHPQEGIIMQPVDATVKGQHYAELLVKNFSEEDIVLDDRCPMPPVDVWMVASDGERTPLTTEETALPCVPLLTIPKGETASISLAPWKYSLFSTYGTYDVALPVVRQGPPIETRFTYYEVGTMTQLFRTFISKPLLNGLVFIASMTPGYNLGVAIIILTLIVKLILFIPTQHAMEGQRKMQTVQPKMDALRAKYKDNPQRLQQETMKIWKEHGVNPWQSCLPMLIQFPILIGLFYTIRDGSVLALSQHLLYSPYQHLTWSFGTQFLGLDLMQPNVFIMPPLLMVMQFFQMKLSFAISKKKEEKKGNKKGKEAMSQQEIQQRVMLYGLPVMIGFFALKFPAAVSLYWGVSTVFAIGQQLFVNRRS
ncbi:MAG: membrane protein insertase YidC [Candidatus Peregrinibacteria bacterium]|nr:membrane protein insertase YidC [Candidatus Peregrinibacteria bacterium]